MPEPMGNEGSIKVLVTGANGFLGKNFSIYLERQPQIKLMTFSKNNTLDELEEKISDCDYVFHFAGVNRSNNAYDFIAGNTKLTAKIIDLMKKTNSNPVLFFASSTQANIDNIYGKTKREAEEYILTNHQNNSISGHIYRFPNLYGRFSKPFYNSVIATFCYNVSRDKPITISDPKIKLKLLFIGDVVTALGNLLKLKNNARFSENLHQSLEIHEEALGYIASEIQSFKKSIEQDKFIPQPKTSFSRKLLLTYLSYIPVEKSLFMINNFENYFENIFKKTTAQLKANSITKFIENQNEIIFVNIKKSRLKISFLSRISTEKFSLETDINENYCCIIHPSYHVSFVNLEATSTKFDIFSVLV